MEIKGILTINSDDFICFSKHAGDNKDLTGLDYEHIQSLKNITGYNDTAGNVNFRVKLLDEKIFVR